MSDTINYTPRDLVLSEAILGDYETDALLDLRNNIADNLGVAKLRSFKDHATAVAQTWKAAQKWQETVDAEAAGQEQAKEAKPKKPKAPKEKKPYVVPKSAQPGFVKRPTRRTFDTIEIIGEHDGTTAMGRPEAWPFYKSGMTMAEIVETNGTEKWCVDLWVSKGLMKIVEATDEEYAERRAAWFAKEGREDPEAVKAAKKAAAEKAKAEKAKAAAEAGDAE